MPATKELNASIARAQSGQAIDRLRPYSTAITGLADRQIVRFNAETWRRWLREARWSDPDIEAALETFTTEQATRDDLRRLSTKTESTADRRRLLVATLIWGRGTANGRMRRHIVGLLQHPDLDRVLAHTADLVHSNEPAAAYRAWTLPGLREPFFTKWLWAASVPSQQNVCLVLDTRVWNTLNKSLRWNSAVAAGSRRRSVRYSAYVQACHQWAQQLGSGIKAEDVECALFVANGDLTHLNQR